ncbi:MAG: alpha/beta fold hydrolase [Actinobacteria bacterium]|nr:alpha/beta fold hydrolase [Actinomycetota bacterium]
MQNASFNVDNLKLDATIFYPPNRKDKNPAILFVHGWTGKKENSYQYAKSLSKLGFTCFLFDMRGHGKSEGNIKVFTIKEFLDDVLAAYDYLITLRGIDKDSINAIGSSFGGYLISLLSKKRKIKNLSMRVPADYPNEEFNKSKYKASGSDNPQLVEWRNKERKSNETYALQALHNFNGNIQIIESEKDTVVPSQTIQNYINAVTDKSKLTHIIIKDAPHSIKEGPFRDKVEQILVDWFKNKI